MTTDELRAIFCKACTAEPLAEGWPELEKFGLAVAAAERDACAKVCEERSEKCATKADATDDEDDRTELKANAWQFSVLAAEIRMRSNTTEISGSVSCPID